MCGISGVFNRRGISPEDVCLTTRMTAAIAHRGPDDSGSYDDPFVTLGHRRLSIIDLSRNGHQPMSNEDGTIWIVFNGEIYNFRELKKKFRLEEKGHQFRSATDTEVLLHLYEELGPGMAEHLNGMYAFAIWDTRSKELHLARDRHGIKPLFYSWQGDRLLFGSEIKAILQDPRVKRRVNFQALHDYLTFDYVPGPQTAFEGVDELPPAHWMTARGRGDVETFRYWKLQFDVDRSLAEADVVRDAGKLMDTAVERQLIADVPVGVLLSGGMDSSSILALMRRHTNEAIHTYSVGFEDASFNELPFAAIAAGAFNSVPHEIVVTPDRVRELLPKYLSYIDEPYADGSAIPTYYVCQIAKGEVVVVLSGEGGDEAFAGYETYSAFKVSQYFRNVPRWIRRGILAPIIHRLPVSDKKLSLEFKAKRFLGGQDLPAAKAHLWWRIVLSEAQKRELYTPRVLESCECADSDRHFLAAFEKSAARDTLNRLLDIDTSVFLPDDLMIKNDRMSMAHSLEARVPLTDHELVEYMARVPTGIKLPGLRKKNVMREAMRGTLPVPILNKKKVGLEMPYSRWLKRELNDILMKHCGPRAIADCGLFRPAAVQSLIDEHVTGRRDHGRALWGLLNYMIWLDLYQPSTAS
jgi:asparagine synthase (glutamine-hydrolysing)